MNTQCHCGHELYDIISAEIDVARVGQGRVTVTCPACDTMHTLAIEWEPRLAGGIEEKPADPDELNPMQAKHLWRDAGGE